ncbi:creatine kinase, flagellar isoform X1 [Nematostella vectensis]|uniref:creatine kinase, flagellar isoform X1 n=3 Tax=Nematostella vectensis TaxID=45351 RepID=UPI0020778286|nr:creatine kinase, flagellar isoform X1 [Nematostella vectensis]
MGCGASKTTATVKGVKVKTVNKKLVVSDNFPDFSTHNNWMAKCMTKDVYQRLSNLQTPSGYTLDMAIQTGVDNPGHPFIMTVGCVAGDEESYDVFADMFDPVIEKRHDGYRKTDMHKTDLNPDHLIGGDDLDEKYVLSCRVRTGRSIRGLGLPPHCTRAERREVEKVSVEALDSLDGEFKGKYYPLSNMTAAEQDQLIDDHFLFDKPVSPLLLASRMARDWPDARGIWHNDNKTFLVWVNEEDHTRVISMQKGGNMKEVFTRFCNGLNKVEKAIKSKGREFMWNKHLGYVLTCPSNLGTGLRGGVHVKLPLLSKEPRFDSILRTLRLQKRGTGGVDTASTDGTFDISNLDRLGTSEVEQVQKVIDGVKALIEIEKALEAGKPIDGIIPRKPQKMLASNFPDLTKHNNWMAKCLTPAVYNMLSVLKTPTGYTLDMAIQTGVDNPGHPFIMTVGCVAGDEESYDVFADMFDPVIEKRHNGYKKTAKHKTDLNPSNLIGGDDLDEKYVLSCRVRTGRSIRGLCLPPWCSRAERREVEKIVTSALAELDGPLAGKYYSLMTMTEAEQDQLIDDHFLFDKPVSPLLLASRMARDWPDARGIWHNDNKTFLVWVNEEDHTRVISMQKGGNMKEVFARFCNGLNKVESLIKSKGYEFMWNEHLGYVLTCPSNLGTGLRGGVHVKLPLLSARDDFDSLLKALRLQKRGTGGVDTASTDGTFDISNADRLGTSEVEQVQTVVDGVKLMVELEKALEINVNVKSFIHSVVAGKKARMIVESVSKAREAEEKKQSKKKQKGKKPALLCDGFPDLSKHNNYMAKFLTRDVYNKLCNLKTPSGFTLDGVIQTGVDNPGHPFIFTVGCVAGDEETYKVFAALLDPVIEARHNGYLKGAKHVTDLNPDNLVGGDDLDANFVLSCRVRTGRSIRGLGLPPHCTRAERREVEKITVDALATLDGPLKGKYYPLSKMTDAEQEQLINDHFLFDKPVSPLLLSARMARDWPDARGIWHNDAKNFLVWVNEEDHTRVISMQQGGNMREVFHRFCNGLKKIEDAMKAKGKEFMWDEHLGYVLTCPSNLGTGLRGGVHVKLPMVSKDARFDGILEKLRLQKRGTGGVDTASTDGTFDISNLDRIGFSEVQLVQKVIDGVKILVEMEKKLMAGQSIDELMP